MLDVLLLCTERERERERERESALAGLHVQGLRERSTQNCVTLLGVGKVIGNATIRTDRQSVIPLHPEHFLVLVNVSDIRKRALYKLNPVMPHTSIHVDLYAY